MGSPAAAGAVRGDSEVGDGVSVMPKTIDAVYVERLFRIEDPAAWGGNLELRIDGIHRQQFPDLAAAGLTMAEQAAVLGDRQGLLLALPCTPAELGEFIEAEGLLDRRTALWLRMIRRARAAAPEVAPKPLPRQRAQEMAILAALRNAGFDPQALPRSAPGKACPAKARARAALPEMTDRVFGKAWQRLRNSREIGGGRP